MVKVITIWRNPGSGESMFCCILIKTLTRDENKATLINTDTSVFMFPVWLPEQLIPVSVLVGQVLSSVEIDTALAAGHATVLKSYPLIGPMGYCAGENPLSYPEMKYDMAMALTATVLRSVDFVTFNCSSAMTSASTSAATKSGDLVTRILTPDLEGIHYLKAHRPLLADSRFRYHGHLALVGLARLSRAIGEMGHLIGSSNGLLPYGKKVDRYATGGGMFHAISYCNSKCTVSLNKVLKILEPKEEKRQQGDFVGKRQEGRADEQSEWCFFHPGSQ